MSPEMGAGKRTVYWNAKLFFLGWFLFLFSLFFGGGRRGVGVVKGQRNVPVLPVIHDWLGLL